MTTPVQPDYAVTDVEIAQAVRTANAMAALHGVAADAGRVMADFGRSCRQVADDVDHVRAAMFNPAPLRPGPSHVLVFDRATARLIYGKGDADRAIRAGWIMLPKAPAMRLIREPWAPRRRHRRPCRR